MYHKHQTESFLHKGLRYGEEALKVYGTAQGLYQAATSIGQAVRGAYQIASPALALL